MKKITALIIVSLFALLPLLIADVVIAEAESYATPLPGEVERAAPLSIDLTPLLQAAIALCAALITGRLIPWIRNKTTEKQFENLEAAARVAVYAAEQIYGAAGGEAKLEYAIAKLKEQGFTLDFDLLREAVESVVYKMNYEKRLEATVAEYRAGEGDAAEPKAEVTATGQGTVLLTPIEEWPADMLEAFCRMSEIPCENCVSAEDFVSAIHRAKEALHTEATAAQEATEAPAAPEEDSEAPVSEAE